MSHSAENQRRTMKIGTSHFRRGAIAAVVALLALIGALTLAGKLRPASNHADSSASVAEAAAKAASRAMTFTEKPEPAK